MMTLYSKPPYSKSFQYYTNIENTCKYENTWICKFKQNITRIKTIQAVFVYAFCVCLCRWRQHEATLLRCCLCIRLCIPGHSVAALPQLQGQVCGLPGPRHVVPQHFPQWWVDAVWVWESMGRSVCFSLPICCTSSALSATASRAGLFHYRNWKTLKPQLPMTWTCNNSWALVYRFCLVAVTMLSSLCCGLCWLSNINIVKTIKDPYLY